MDQVLPFQLQMHMSRRERLFLHFAHDQCSKLIVLAPILFLLYINDLLRTYIPRTTVHFILVSKVRANTHLT